MARFKATTKVIDKDKGFGKIKRNLNQATRGLSAAVGIHQEDGIEIHDTSKSVNLATIAQIHEFGLPDHNIDSRSFLRSSFDETNGFRSDVVKLFNLKVLRNLGPLKALEILALSIEKYIQAKIRKGIEPDLADSTLKRKTVDGKVGFIPLINTGQLLRAIKGKVTKK